MKWLGAILALLAGATAAWVLMWPGATVRYRLTLVAQVDDEIRSGSSVIEVNYHKNPKLLPNEAEFSTSVKGQALALDLGERGTLFALLREGSDVRSAPEWIVLRAFSIDHGSMPRPIDDGLKQVRTLSGKVGLALENLPLLVRFRDPDDPRSVEEVDPLDIGKTFGPQARLVHATLEIVPAGMWPFNTYGNSGEPISTGIEQRLPWWNGPFPWLKPIGNGVFVDTRSETFKVNKEDFKRG